jgi:hypothetical protein
MAFERYLVLGFLVLHASLTNTIAVRPKHYSTASLNRSSFPAGFIFGTASASYQVYIRASSFSSPVLRFLNCMMMCVVCNSSMKVQQRKVVEEHLYGTLSPIHIQVTLSSLSSKIKWYFELEMHIIYRYCVEYHAQNKNIYPPLLLAKCSGFSPKFYLR